MDKICPVCEDPIRDKPVSGKYCSKWCRQEAKFVEKNPREEEEDESYD